MKQSYKKDSRYIKSKIGWVELHDVYSLRHTYFRRIKTLQEIRNNVCLDRDERAYSRKVKLRRCRLGKSLCSWNLERRGSMAFKKSWKMAYKCCKQLMTNR